MSAERVPTPDESGAAWLDIVVRVRKALVNRIDETIANAKGEALVCFIEALDMVEKLEFRAHTLGTDIRVDLCKSDRQMNKPDWEDDRDED